MRTSGSISQKVRGGDAEGLQPRSTKVRCPSHLDKTVLPTQSPVTRSGGGALGPCPLPRRNYSRARIKDFGGLIWKGGELSGVFTAPTPQTRGLALPPSQPPDSISLLWSVRWEGAGSDTGPASTSVGRADSRPPAGSTQSASIPEKTANIPHSGLSDNGGKEMLPGNACSWTSYFDRCPDVPDTTPDSSHDKKDPQGALGAGTQGAVPTAGLHRPPSLPGGSLCGRPPRRLCYSSPSLHQVPPLHRRLLPNIQEHRHLGVRGPLNQAPQARQLQTPQIHSPSAGARRWDQGAWALSLWRPWEALPASGITGSPWLSLARGYITSSLPPPSHGCLSVSVSKRSFL